MNVYSADQPKNETPEVERHSAEPVNSAKVRKPLYEARKKIFPKRAEGRYRQFKWLVMLVTLGIYYIGPWIRWDRGPFAPNQAILIDIAHRRFYFFFIEIWPQEFFYVAGLLVMAGFGLFLITSAVGRAWCGYTCPQTVWVDLFLVVERFIEGDRNARMKLDKAPWSFEKLAKRVTKHAIWIAIGISTGGAWIFYFADAPQLLIDLWTLQAAPVAYMTVAVLTATTYLFGGLMREQVCTYMCPWPRIQAAMLDESSLVVTYNDWRGEPRTRGTKKAAAEGKLAGDCVDCNACVVVCPMGIDIREGQQLECITCALCIDACDGVMDKLGRDKGLISYATLADYASNMAIATGDGTHEINPNLVRDADGHFHDKMKHFDWRVIFRPRTLLYMAVWSAVGIGLVVTLLSRDRLEMSVLHDRNPQFVMESDGSIRNGYIVRLLNMIPTPRVFTLSLDGLPEATMKINGLDPVDGRSFDVPVEADKALALKVYITMPSGKSPDETEHFHFLLREKGVPNGEHSSYDAVFNAPNTGEHH
jgi:cytochrome c oxidase accessory protein FixG